MFGARPFEKDEILELLSGIGDCRPIQQTKNILILNIDGVKVDFVNYKYPLIQELKLEAGIRLIDLPDIAAMKLGAITGRGRKRAFINLYFLLQQYSLKALLAFYNQKYPDGAEFLVARSLTYFEDADGDEDLHLFLRANWSEVKKTITQEVKKLFK